VEMQRMRATVEYYSESPQFVIFMSLLTFWALYSTDIRLASTYEASDPAFEGVMTFTFFMFLLEICLQSFYKPDYLSLPDWEPLPDELWYQTWVRRLWFGSFYFWLDTIAALSIMLELQWMLGSASKEIRGTDSQSGAGRIVRVVRMVRLIRMIKLYKYAAAAHRKGQFSFSAIYARITCKKMSEEETLAIAAAAAAATSNMYSNTSTAASEVATATQESMDEPSESRVGAAMSDLTNRRVIVLILLMLIIIPVLTISEANTSFELGLRFVHDMAVLNRTDPATYESGLLLALQTVQSELPVISLYLDSYYYYDDATKVADLRAEEKRQLERSVDGFYTKILYNVRDQSVDEALFSIYTTSFVIVLLIFGTYFFSNDVNRLVIRPIERLVDLVRKISANPLGVEYKMMGEKEGFLEGMETTVLLTTITKIGGLMKVGFGEAGANVIAKNLADSSGGRLNLMGAGAMIHSIFGFCDVRQFTDATECLQEEVMLFVNRIAHILHQIVVQCSGAANKNIGDAFLLTWKLDDKLSTEEISDLADQALLAFCKSLIELCRYQDFIVNFSVAATARLYKRFPEYAVRIGCGLHVGWAIEGAIGSHRKIDASYLSPHVNNTEYLESSTKQYGVALLLSEPFFRLLSPAASKYCRQVDRIRRSEFEDPMGLFTYDTDLTIDWNDTKRHVKKKFNIKAKLLNAAKRAQSNMSEQRAREALASVNNTVGAPRKTSVAKRGSVLAGARGRRQSVVPSLGLATPTHSTITSDSAAASVDPETGESAADIEAKEQKKKQAPTIHMKRYAQAVWVTDQEIGELRHKVNDAFRNLWEQGINAYIKGDWQKARDIFHETMRLSRNKDGPSKFLMRQIDENGGTAPQDWPGYREDY